MAYIEFGTRILLAAVFLAAAVSKARSPASLAETIRRIGVDSRLTMATAWGVIAYEAALGLLFALGVVPMITALAALALLVIFACVSLIAMKSRRTIPCNCFGASDTPLGAATLARSALLLLAIVLYYLGFRFVGLIWWPTSVDVAVSASSLAVAAALFGRWLLVIRDIAALVRDRHQRDTNDDARGDVPRRRMQEGKQAVGGTGIV